MRTRSVVLLTLAVLGFLGGTWILLSRATPMDERYIAEHSVDVPEAARTVTVSETMPMPSAHERRLSAMLEKGRMPRSPMMAEVLSDTDCAPDMQMISRCRNEMRLRDGQKLVLRHPHDMSRIPCLAPGEEVLLLPASA